MDNLEKYLKKCNVCPNSCGVDRLAGEKGKCRIDASLFISQASLHFGEEPVLVGRGGSGTVFFSACNLSCVFCQNYEISQLDSGKTVTEQDLLRIFFSLRARGAVNINLVSPTHQAPRIFAAVKKARRDGLRLPIVYNCGGYENPDFIRDLVGLVDIYMPDFKYGDDAAAETYSGCRRYFDNCGASLVEMQRQVGSLRMDERGVAVRGLLVRHLVLPNGEAASEKVIDFIAEHVSLDTYLNIMDQYRPCHRANEYPRISRRTALREVDEVTAYARRKGLTRILR